MVDDCEYCHEDLNGFVKPLGKNGHAYLDTRCINAQKLIIGFGRAIRICKSAGRPNAEDFGRRWRGCLITSAAIMR